MDGAFDLAPTGVFSDGLDPGHRARRLSSGLVGDAGFYVLRFVPFNIPRVPIVLSMDWIQPVEVGGKT
jgi:hypothetical protein